VSLDEHSQSPQGQQAYPAPPPPAQPGVSGLAIAGLILAFLVAPIGFILSLIAVFKTGAGRAKGRGLAIAGIIISVLIMAGAVTAGLLVANSTVADPGCVTGKAAILDNSKTNDTKSLQATIDGLHAATAKAKHDDVRAALTALADDYSQILKANQTGKVPEGIEAKATADGTTFDSLCTIGG
jgi:hypothetical protein